MTLSFSTHWADGKPNYFVGKIWSSILNDEYNKTKRKELTQKLYQQYYDTCYGMTISRDTIIKHPNDVFGEFGFDIDYPTDLQPKLHTLRQDKKDRWKAGNKIHPVINNRTPNRFQFAPTLECKRVQDIHITYYRGIVEISVDDRHLSPNEINKLFINDGFNSMKEFMDFFFSKGKLDFTGVIIHWTDLKY